MARRGDTHRLLRWLWTSRRLEARLARLLAAPGCRALASGHGGTRDTARARGWIRADVLPLPAVSVGNLTIGDSGHSARPDLDRTATTPRRGSGPAFWYRGPRRGGWPRSGTPVPDAAVAAATDAGTAARRLESDGAEVLVLERAGAAAGGRPQLTVAVLGAETSRAVRWPLPAGPWREGWRALARVGPGDRDPEPRAAGGRPGARRRAPRAHRRDGGDRPSWRAPPRGPGERRRAALSALAGQAGWSPHRASPIPMPSWPR